jgi:hypothetical protein
VTGFVFSWDDDVIDIGEYVSANLVLEYGLREAGKSRPSIFSPLGFLTKQ